MIAFPKASSTHSPSEVGGNDDFRSYRRCWPTNTGMRAGWALVRSAAQAWVDGSDRRIAPPVAKLFCTDMVGRVASHGVQIHGGTGYIRDVPGERIYRDARLLRRDEGTSEIQRLVIDSGLVKNLRTPDVRGVR